MRRLLIRKVSAGLQEVLVALSPLELFSLEPELLSEDGLDELADSDLPLVEFESLEPLRP
jgi:hypothetical protein